MFFNWFSNEIQYLNWYFYKNPKNFSIFPLIVLFNAALIKQISCKIFVHDAWRKDFLSGVPLCALQDDLNLKTLVLVGLITKW